MVINEPGCIIFQAKQLTAEYPLASVEDAVENATTFAEILDESYNLAITVAYQGLVYPKAGS